ncbi:probable LRR receptor-like serine/threonine-protein kinase At1g51880 [Pyrus x bretschneideri]|uniref:probable LRR receptor-like serine/threonine-protein kinase At1g51880 n=1 Tax=Pyrus x bretschneideri TaxID=225117 RepID=UPI00203097FF|nr:probable LRR receptor-like serine/threonine-protein kinase At1g51880 [Pyrus x bretschneideri]
MKISISFLVLPLCARVVHGECRIDSSKCKKNIVVPIFGSLLSAVALLLVIVLILAWKIIRLRKPDGEKRNKTPLASKKSQFTYDEVLEIIEDFQIDIGKGGFGIVYNGYLKDGTQVAVKILSPLSSTEVELLPRIHHRNLTSLLGYSDDSNNLALKYGYMPNGNLKESLSDRKLTYDLGTETSDSIRYCVRLVLRVILIANRFADVNTANILLSEKLDAKIANFSLSMVFPNDNKIHVVASVMGTVGYGVVLLELITGQLAIIESDDLDHIVEWVSPEFQNGDLTTILDRRIRGEFDVNSVWKALETAMACTTFTSQHKASMVFVLCQLTQCLEMEVSRHRERTPG